MIAKIVVVAEIFSLEVFDRSHSTLAANRRWWAFVPLCKRMFNRDAVIFSRTRYVPYLRN